MAPAPLIVYLAPTGDDQRGTTFLNELTQAWPEHATKPRTHTLTPDQFSDALSRHPTTKHLPPPTSWSATLLDPRLPANDIRVAQALDKLDELHIPAIELSDPTSTTPTSNYATAIQLPVRTPPTEAAWALYALCARQPAVRLIASALRLVQSSQGEAADTLDRMNEELLIAAKVQRDFLPDKLPTSDRLDAAVLFRPAGVVSGDIYDAVRLDDRYTAFFMADAMGHGVPAALMTLFMTRSVPTRAGNSDDVCGGSDPAASLAALNAEMAASRGGPTRFSTAVCGVIDTHSGLVRIASAGHPPIVVISSAGVRYIEASGLLLGVLPDTEYESFEFTLAPGETMLVHSDGLDDALRTHPNPTPPGGPPSHPRLAHLHTIMDENATAGPAHAIAAIEKLLDSMSGSLNPLDDVTVMAFSVLSVPALSMPQRPEATTAEHHARSA